MSNRLIIRRLSDNTDGDGWLAGIRSWLTAEELAAAENFAPRRRRDFLTWRAAVRQELGRDVEISYDASGAPLLGGGLHIGVSHSANIAVVIVGDAPCAVDTEPLTRNFERVRRRYMTESEAVLSDDGRLPAAVWCAKEALYKLGGGCGCDFLRDIVVTEVDFAAGRICGTVCGSAPVVLKMEIFEDNIIVFNG